MADNASGEQDLEVPEEGGILSQSELDALLAAVESEPAGSDTDPEAWQDELAAAAAAESAMPASAPLPSPSVVDLPSFEPRAPSPVGGRGLENGTHGMSRVRDIPLEVTVELGRTRLLIKDILDLGTGSIIELDKIAGEPVDLFANGLLVARGEVIVIDDNFGVRVTEIITAAERRHMQDTEADALAA